MNPLEARRRLLGRNVYKRTTEGNPAIAQGSLARRYPGITMQGWTEQAQYEGKNLFDISDFESNNKGIIENGTILFKQSLGTVTYYLSLSPGTYSISIKRSGYSGINIKVNEVAVINSGGGNNSTNNFDVSDGDSVVLEFSEGQNPNGEDRMIYDIMLNSGSAALPYEPYTGGQPSPNPDYPQPITSAGKYDEETQKWEYEIAIANEQTDPDKNQSVTLTSDRPLTKWDRLIKKDGVWGWEYGSDEYIAPKTGYRMFNRLESATGVYFLYTIWDDIGIEISAVLQNQFCNYFKLENPYAFKGNAFWIVKLNEIDKPVLRIGLSDENIDTVEEFEQFLSALDDIKILYKKANTEFVPLSSEEQEAMNSLYTFRPTTVLSNDCGCNMTLTYKTKKSLEVAT